MARKSPPFNDRNVFTMIDDSQRSAAGQDDFLSVLAHELRNPLAPLRNGLQIIRLAKNDTAAVDHALDVMDRQLNQLVKLIDDLLDASRINRGQVELRQESLDVVGVLSDAIEELRPATEQKELQLTAHFPSAPVRVKGDSKRLRQVFANLLANATKYSGRGGAVEIAAEKTESHVEITFSDHGMGISTEMLPRIFDMFAKADRSLEKAQDGLGIGLTIAKKIVELHGGDLVAYSDGVGTGSRFVVRLPVSAEVARRAGPRVLVVDDNRDLASSMQIMLGMMGSETQTAQDGMEALKIAATFRPEVVFLDIGLPKLNGYDVCRVIREQAWGKNVTIVALTGWGQNEDVARSQEAGFNHHLVKPVDNAALEKIMQEAGQALTV